MCVYIQSQRKVLLAVLIKTEEEGDGMHRENQQIIKIGNESLEEQET